MRRSLIWLFGALAISALLPSACGSDERLGEAPNSKLPDAGSDAKLDALPPPPDGGKDAGPVIRSVETRNRFGSLDPTNFLLDGDFEYSGMDVLQYGWFGVENTWIVTGARCRNGLRCIEIPESQYAAGIFVWPEAGSVDFGYYAKPSGTGDCIAEVGGIVVPLANYPGQPAPMQLSASVAEKDADGWCHVTETYSVPSDTGDTFWSVIIAPQDTATGPILVDDASVRVAGSGGSTALARKLTPQLTKLVARARADFAKRPPVPPRAEPAPVKNRTGRRH